MSWPLFCNNGCSSINFCGTTLPESPAKASQRCPLSSFFATWHFSRNALRMHFLGEGPFCCCHLHGRDGWQVLSLVTSLLSPGSLWALTQVTHRNDLSECYSHRWRQSLIQDVCAGAWDAAFLITSQGMLVCGERGGIRSWSSSLHSRALIS